MLEFEVRLTAEEPAAKKQPVHKAPVTAREAVAATADGEADILNWVKEEEKARSSLLPTTVQEVVRPQHTQPEESPAEAQAVAMTNARVREKIIELDAVDLLLLSLIGPLVLVFLSFVPTFWIWQGTGALVLAVLASVCVTRVPRRSGVSPHPSDSSTSGSGKMPLVRAPHPPDSSTSEESGRMPLLQSQQLKLDVMHVATGILVTLVLGLMSPALWIWQVGAVVLLAMLCLALAVRIKRITGDKLDETNLTLIVACGLLLVLIVAVSLLLSAMLWMQLSGAGIVIVAMMAMFWSRRKQPTSQKFDRILWRLMTLGILLVVFFGFLFPIPSWWPDWLNLREWPYWLTWSTMEQCWSWFRLQALRNWSSIWWLRWGMVAFWAALITVLLLIRARRESARMSHG